MIIEFDKKYLENIYDLGTELNEKYRNLYDVNSLNKDVNKTYILLENNYFVGFIHIQELVDEIDIIDIIIDRNYRHNGYATKLLDYIFDINKDKKFILEVNVNNIPAINLYLKHGFIEIYRRKGYYNANDAIVMEKK
jgi:ribosomal-protein-alanine N-acetyltransferase